ncbi:MAG: N-acetylglucosamine-6-phosphate deacetylase [Eubacteriales bacterium]
MLLKNCNLLSSEGVFVKTDLQFEEKIQKIAPNLSEENSIDLEGKTVVPGLIDIHSHGAMGKDASDGDPAAMEILSNYYARVGVTSWCPTTMTLKEETLMQAISAIKSYEKPCGAKVAGIYLEGPFFHHSKRGAQAEENLATPDVAMFERLRKHSGDNIAVLALAPDLEGGVELIKEGSKHCTVALGHTAADYDTAMTAFANGASLAVHLYNGMMPFGHRSPNVVGAAYDSGAFVELICDGLHIHPSVIRVTFGLFGKKMVLISDSLRCAGMPDGEYELGGQPIVMNDGKATLLNGTLAGSSIGLLDAVRNCISFGIPMADAFYAGSTAPALALGKGDQIGSLEVGKCADFLVLDKDLNLVSTYVDGKKVV